MAIPPRAQLFFDFHRIPHFFNYFNFPPNFKIFDFHQFEKLTNSNLRASPLRFELVSLDCNLRLQIPDDLNLALACALASSYSLMSFFFLYREEAQEYIDMGSINSLFVLGRSIGFIGE